jgi:hypothetical protein
MTEELVNAQALASAPPSQESATAQDDATLAEAQKTIALMKSELEKCQSKLVTSISLLQIELKESKSTITAKIKKFKNGRKHHPRTAAM